MTDWPQNNILKGPVKLLFLLVTNVCRALACFALSSVKRSGAGCDGVIRSKLLYI